MNMEREAFYIATLKSWNDTAARIREQATLACLNKQSAATDLEPVFPEERQNSSHKVLTVNMFHF